MNRYQTACDSKSVEMDACNTGNHLGLVEDPVLGTAKSDGVCEIIGTDDELVVIHTDNRLIRNDSSDAYIIDVPEACGVVGI
ncbi:MAG: hypothetical protein AUI36_36580 [Cyanobacteria bacterium 13_1_40CM_2_61_4]|nr:MAG: hypothetical protein AUI36_36580 [Cyanobacteria bacterium 13_1_40CM_2_61_4]